MALRVVVSGDDHDLLVPADVPVVELLHGLCPYVGALVAQDHPTRVRLLRPDGDGLLPGLSLRAQGVADGAVLALVPDPGASHRDAVDDPVDAVDAVLADRGRAVRAIGPGRGRAVAVAAPAAVGASVLAVGGSAGASAAGLATGTAVACALAGVLVARRGDDPLPGLTAVAGAGLVGAAIVLREPATTSAVLARLGALLGLLAVAALLALPRRAELALAPTLAGLLAVSAAAAQARLPMTPTQTSVAVLAVAALGARAVPWVAVAAVGVDRATQVAPAGRDRPGTTGGVDLDVVHRAVDATRRTVQAATWGLGAVAVVAAAVAAGAGHGGLLLSVCLGLLLSSSSTGGRPGWWAGPVTGAGVLGVAASAAAAGRADLVPLVLVGVAVATAVALATGVPGVARPMTALVAGLRTTTERLALLAVPPLMACGLGLLPTPWGLP